MRIFLIMLFAISAFAQTGLRSPAFVANLHPLAAAAGGGGTVTPDFSYSTNFTTSAASPTTRSNNFTMGSGADRALFVFTSVADTGNGPDTDSVTANGVSMTLVRSNRYNANSTQKMWQLVNPASGTIPILVTFRQVSSATVTIHEQSYSSVSQSVPVANSYTNGGSGVTSTITVTSSTGNAVFAGHQGGSSFSAVNKTQVGIQNVDGNTAGGNGASNRDVGAASVVLTGTLGSDSWGVIGIDINHD